MKLPVQYILMVAEGKVYDHTKYVIADDNDDVLADVFSEDVAKQIVESLNRDFRMQKKAS